MLTYQKTDLQLDALKHNIHNYHRRKKRLEQNTFERRVNKPKASVGNSEPQKPDKSLTQQVKFAEDA